MKPGLRRKRVYGLSRSKRDAVIRTVLAPHLKYWSVIGRSPSPSEWAKQIDSVIAPWRERGESSPSESARVSRELQKTAPGRRILGEVLTLARTGAGAVLMLSERYIDVDKPQTLDGASPALLHAMAEVFESDLGVRRRATAAICHLVIRGSRRELDLIIDELVNRARPRVEE